MNKSSGHTKNRIKMFKGCSSRHQKHKHNLHGAISILVTYLINPCEVHILINFMDLEIKMKNKPHLSSYKISI